MQLTAFDDVAPPLAAVGSMTSVEALAAAEGQVAIRKTANSAIARNESRIVRLGSTGPKFTFRMVIGDTRRREGGKPRGALMCSTRISLRFMTGRDSLTAEGHKSLAALHHGCGSPEGTLATG